MRSTGISKGCRVAAGLLLLCLTACVTVPKTELDPSAAVRIHSIALLMIPEPQTATVMDLGGAPSASELSGGFAQADLDSSHSAAYTRMLASRDFSFSKAMAVSLMRSLRGSGYQIAYLSDQSPKLASDGKSDDFSGIHTDADAVLVVWYTAIGYVASPGTSHYVPWVGARARLLDTKTGRNLYFKTFSAGYKSAAKNVINLPADTRYQYPGFDALMQQGESSIAGLAASIDDVAAHIGRDFAPTSSSAAAAPTASLPPAAITGTPGPRTMSPQYARPAAPAIVDDGLVALRQPTAVLTQPQPRAAMVAVLPAGQRIRVDPRTRTNAFGNWNYVQSGSVSGWALNVDVTP